ncbi:MAG TPA: PAS domain S-box protein [Sandaracinaceae bacterium LLY-WYZ-13_1]|nr:PAS domain S-box protein [Sandaracinaceae bacterium LLY-WYZ-13_1]
MSGRARPPRPAVEPRGPDAGPAPWGAARLAAVLESSADAIIAMDLDGVIRSWNVAAERLYGYTAREALGRSIRLVIPENRAAEMTALLEQVRRGAPVQHMRTVRVDAEGREVHVELTVSPVRDTAGLVVGKSAIARDVTEQWQAEERFRLAVEAAPSAMIMVDAEGAIEMVNAETERLFGYPREALVGRPVEDLVPERFRAGHPGLRAGFVRHPEFRAMGAGRELFGVRRDGTEIPIEIGLNPIETSGGLRVLCSIVDITERKKADTMFRLAVEAAPSGIAMVDEHGDIVLVNAETERMFRYGRGALVGRSIDTLVPHRFRGQHGHHRRGFVAEPQARAMGMGRELFGLRADGTEFPVEIGLNPISTDGRTFVLSTIVDITRRKRTEEELERQREELARSNEELEQFAYVASHDLQEPLRMVSSYTSLLASHLGDDLDEDAARFIAFAQDGASRMRALIQDLLALSRVRTRGRELVALDARACIERALANLGVSLAETDARVEVDVSSRVRGDATQVVALFQNLISNALKFRGDEAPHIRIGEQRVGDFVRFRVQDNGIGIPPRHAGRVFQLFERLHTREEHPGTGIGLALCRRVVERHGGRIGVESEGAGGSTFHFTLPAA